MSRWDTQPAGVHGVLRQVKGVAEDFEGHLRTINKALEGAGTEASSGIVAQALTGFAESQRSESQRSDIQFVFSRTGAAMTGAVNVTQAYVRGDLEMAANAPVNANAASDARAMPRGTMVAPRARRRSTWSARRLAPKCRWCAAWYRGPRRTPSPDRWAPGVCR